MESLYISCDRLNHYTFLVTYWIIIHFLWQIESLYISCDR